MKRTRALIRILSFALILLMCAPLCACSQLKDKHTETYFEYFDTFCTLTVYSTGEDFERYNEIFATELERYHRLLDIYSSYDGVANLHTINQNAGKEPVQVGDELFDFLVRATELCELTDGYTSITMGAVTSVWKKAIANKTVPDGDVLSEAAKHTDISLLVLDKQSKTAYLADTQARLDAGALAKGYVSDKLRAALIDVGCESFLIDLGGNLSSHGIKQNGGEYVASVEDPIKQTALNTRIALTDRTLSTSGSYNRGFEKDGIRYHHIIDPFTQMPKNTYVSTSVLCTDGAMADALSTALFSMSYEDGRALIDSLDGTEAIWIFADGRIEHTSGIIIN